MSLEEKSLELKDLLSCYSTEWFLGELSFLMTAIAENKAPDQLSNLSSPQRQLYYLAGLLITSDDQGEDESHYNSAKWKKIVELLNDIEQEYYKLFFPKEDESIDEQWEKTRLVAMPTFLAYFNQGHLNYEEQTINWVVDLYSNFTNKIRDELELEIDDFLNFYNSLNELYQNNLQGHTTNRENLRTDWQKHSKLKVAVRDDIPEFFKEKLQKRFEGDRPIMTFTADRGIISRFYPRELVSDNLSLDKVERILNLLSTERSHTDFMYYTETRPGNPIYRFPIIKLESGLFQVFDVKQVIYAIDLLFESTCCSSVKETSKLSNAKGRMLEQRIVSILTNYFSSEIEIFTSYYVDGSEQDILILWDNHALIIEAKGYKVAEPFRDPEKAYKRIKSDFEDSIGYAYKQINRVQQKFKDQEELIITDKKGRIIKEIDTTKYIDNDFGIIVNLNSFGQIQNDLSILMPLENEDYPLVIKIDDLEVFLLTLDHLNKGPVNFIEYLSFRKTLHGKLICSDELEIGGAFLTGAIDNNKVEKSDYIATTPRLAKIFDKIYLKGMGLKNEKYLKEKREGKTVIW